MSGDRPEVRINPTDQRVALLLHLGGYDYPVGAAWKWVCLTAPNGQLTVEILTEDEVGGWVAVALP